MENKKSPLLSICIPTYNREKYLKECLDSIIYQDGFNEEEIEIVISDNASKDGTKELVEEYQKKYTNIRYFRNDENIGALKNILGLPSFAQGGYIWYMSDDDMLSNIALNTIIPILEKKSVDFVLSKFLGFWNGEPIDLQKLNKTGNIIELQGMTEFFDFLGKAKYDITAYLMLLSIFCFRREIFENHLKILLEENGENYIEKLQLDNFIHARIIYMPFGEEKNIAIIEKDLVLCRGGNISWSFHFIVCKDLIRLIQDLHKKYHIGQKTYKKMKYVYYYSVFSYIVMVYIKRIMPAFLYNFCVRTGRKILSFIQIKSSSK